MKTRCHERNRSRVNAALCVLLAVLFAETAGATTRLLLTRGNGGAAGELAGVVELTVNPGFDEAKVSITVDGQKIAEGLRSPYRLMVDFGPTAIEHKIAVTAWSAGNQRVQWVQTVNRGLLPLTVRVQAVDVSNRVFEASVTAPAEDPVTAVEVWEGGHMVASSTSAPYRFTVPAASFGQGFVQVTARTKSGEEAADFWSASGDVHVESVDVRTVPIFVSVVDRNGQTRNDVDQSLFRILDNEAEGTILEFGKAFDQPISIALLLDASASMTYEMPHEMAAAKMFVERMLKKGDRCTVFAVREVPRRMQQLTDDKELVQKAISSLHPGGQTALYDSIASAIRELKGENNRRAIVVLTDGEDTSSVASFDEIDKASSEAGIPIYFISYDSGDPTDAHELDRMNYLSAQTGGFVVTASHENLQAKYEDIEKDLRAQYAIVYQISDLARHNEWRKIRVTLKSPSLNARTIRGYFAP